MTIDIQMKINNDMRLKSFIRENPIWYKKLNRNPNAFKDFTLDMKDKYKLKFSDKLNKTLDNITMLEAFLEVMK